MSGGHFDYAQYRVEEIAREIEALIETNDDESDDKYGFKRGRGYPPEVIERFREAAHTLYQAADMAQRVHWLISGDDGEDTFLYLWPKRVRPYWHDYVRDGHGNEWAKCGPDCDMEVVRPGKVQCSCIEFESQVETGLTNETESKQTRQLERELAEMREQRDSLMFALQNVMDYRQGKPPYDFHQYRESERDNMAHDAWQVMEQNCLSLLSEITTSDRSDVNAINDCFIGQALHPQPNNVMNATEQDEKCPDLLNQTPPTDDPFESADHDNDDYTYAETYNPQQTK